MLGVHLKIKECVLKCDIIPLSMNTSLMKCAHSGENYTLGSNAIV